MMDAPRVLAPVILGNGITKSVRSIGGSRAMMDAFGHFGIHSEIGVGVEDLNV